MVLGRAGIHHELGDEFGVFVERPDPFGRPTLDQEQVPEARHLGIDHPELWGSPGRDRPSLLVALGGDDGDDVPHHDPGIDTGHARDTCHDRLEFFGYGKPVEVLAPADRRADHEVDVTGDVRGKLVEGVADLVGQEERRGQEGDAEDHGQRGQCIAQLASRDVAECQVEHRDLAVSRRVL